MSHIWTRDKSPSPNFWTCQDCGAEAYSFKKPDPNKQIYARVFRGEVVVTAVPSELQMRPMSCGEIQILRVMES